MFHINHLRFPAAFSGSVAREGEFPGDEVDRGGHVFDRPIPAGLALHSREQAVKSLHKGRRQTLSPMGLNPIQVRSIIRAARAIGSSKSPACSRIACTHAHPFPKEFLTFPGILSFVNALKHQSQFVGHASHTPLQGHRLLLLGFFLHPVHSVKTQTIKNN